VEGGGRLALSGDAQNKAFEDVIFIPPAPDTYLAD